MLITILIVIKVSRSSLKIDACQILEIVNQNQIKHDQKLKIPKAHKLYEIILKEPSDFDIPTSL